MALLLIGYFGSFIMYVISIFSALWLMEKIGRKQPETWQERGLLAAQWAAGVTVVQAVAQAVSMIYIGVFL